MFDLLILHLSDIHIAGREDHILRKVKSISAAVTSNIPVAKNILFAVTGDVAYGGTQVEYELATNFIAGLQEEFRVFYKITPHVLVVPGNHDCDFGHSADALRKVLIHNLKTEPQEAAPEILEHCCKVLSSFDDFRDAVETLRPVAFTKLWRQYELLVEDKVFIFHAINNAWAAEKKLSPGSLAFPVSQHLDISAVAGDLRFALLHCPAHWLLQATYRNFRKLIRDSADVVLTGHEHAQNIGTIDDAESGRSIFVEAGALQETGTSHSSFATIGIEIGAKKLFIQEYNLDGERYCPVAPDFREIPLDLSIGRSNKYRFTGFWYGILSDMGAAITHHAKAKLELLDLFVFPDLEAEIESDDASNIVNSRVLCGDLHTKRWILLKGDQSIGKSALLRALALTIHERGYVPIMLNGADFRSSSDKDISKTIARAVNEQYGQASALEISQLPSSCKVLLLDDLDRFGFPEKYFNSVIEVLKLYFGRIIASADKVFDFKAAVRGDIFSSLYDFEAFNVKHLGTKARHELVRKWFQLEPAETRVEEERVQRNISEAEKVLSSVVGRGLVPPFPIYMLVLLQGTEAGGSGELENSALGTYYQYLLVHSLLEFAKQDQVQGIFNYCAHFAWFLKQSDNDRATKSELEKFHAAFEQLFDLEIPFTERSELLIKSRILSETGGEYGFKYSYSFYFFLGSYLAARLDKNEEVDYLVRRAAEALHVRENANILLFVAHHSKSSTVINLVRRSVEKLFVDSVPIKFDIDTEELNKAVGSLPKLVFNEAEVERRKIAIVEDEDRLSMRMDEAAANDDGANEALKLVAALNALFKGIEILGAALKANADNIEADEKQQTIDSIFEGGLRGLKGFIEKLTSAPDYLIGEMQEVLDRKKPQGFAEQQRVASQAIFFYLSSLSYVFIRRIGTAVGARSLRPALIRYVDNDPTVAKRLINLSCMLETPGALPLQEIRRLSSQLDSQAFPLSILRQLGLARIYLYHTEAVERQQMCSELQIEMQTQRAIDYKTRNTKKVG